METSNFGINADYELILDTPMYKIRQIFARISSELSILINAGGKEKIKYSMQLSANTCKYFTGTFTLPRSCTREIWYNALPYRQSKRSAHNRNILNIASIKHSIRAKPRIFNSNVRRNRQNFIPVPSFVR